MGSKNTTRSIALLSGKGGTGKTHIAVNLAILLARQGRRVLLVDTDLGSANISFRIGVKPPCTLVDFYEGKARLNQCIIDSRLGFKIMAGMPGDVAFANIPDEHIIKLLKSFEAVIMSGRFDEVIFDLGAGLSSRVLDFGIVADEIVLVATPNDIVHAYATLKACWNRFCSLQGTEYFSTRTDLTKTPYFLGDNYRDDCGGPRMNFIVNQADNLAHGKQVYLRITQVASEFFYTREGYWKLPMRYLGFLPDAHELLKQS